MGRWCPPCNAAQTSVALSFTRYLLAFCQVCLLKLAATLIDIGNPTQIELNPGGMDSLPLHQWLHYSLIRVIKNFSAAALSFLFSGVSQQRKLIGYARMLHEGRSRGTCARPRERRSFFFNFFSYRLVSMEPTASCGSGGYTWSCGTGWASGICLGLGLPCQAAQQFLSNQTK